MTQAEKISKFCKLAGLDEAKFIANGLSFGQINLCDHPSMESLPEGLNGDYLDLEGWCRIKSLPDKLNVPSLNLRDAP